ncbi:MAG: hypothetical protein MJ089_03160 [Ruminococcus sp.]|nr:hypothetical protein [Ruminococcus sp.]
MNNALKRDDLKMIINNKYILAVLSVLIILFTVGCKGSTTDNGIETKAETETKEITMTENKTVIPTTEFAESSIQIQVGNDTLNIILEDNESANALKKLVSEKKIVMSASNYGGFEKVCTLGATLPKNDAYITTSAGDVCLYNGDKIVIFYGSNSWEYTKLGRIQNKTADELSEILSGNDTEVILKSVE